MDSLNQYNFCLNFYLSFYRIYYDVKLKEITPKEFIFSAGICPTIYEIEKNFRKITSS